MIRILLLIFTLLLFYNCGSNSLRTVTVEEFREFVDHTGYITDAEKYGWSIVQETVFDFRTENNANWRFPNAVDSSRTSDPVTQVSYNDATAYCKWANVSLPSYPSYWKMVKSDKRRIVKDTTAIIPVRHANLVGNVWDITTTENIGGEIRLAGGSYLCNETTCNGTHPSRELYVDKETGNVNIGFSVVK